MRSSTASLVPRPRHNNSTNQPSLKDPNSGLDRGGGGCQVGLGIAARDRGFELERPAKADAVRAPPTGIECPAPRLDSGLTASYLRSRRHNRKPAPLSRPRGVCQHGVNARPAPPRAGARRQGEAQPEHRRVIAVNPPTGAAPRPGIVTNAELKRPGSPPIATPPTTPRVRPVWSSSPRAASIP